MCCLQPYHEDKHCEIPGVNIIFNLPVIGKFMNMVNDSQKRLPV